MYALFGIKWVKTKILYIMKKKNIFALKIALAVILLAATIVGL